jgi:D-alanyl-D-alanine endopeptidase (penicillin-binding protein 7)
MSVPVAGLALAGHLVLLAAVPEQDKHGLPVLRSESVVIRFADTKEILIAKNADVIRPIASVTKLLSGLILTKNASTALDLPESRLEVVSSSVSLTAELLGDVQSVPTATVATSSEAGDFVTITDIDKDRLKWSRSRLKVGLAFRWLDLFRAALGGSDNRAMYASVRAKGWDRAAFVEKMNELARALGMSRSQFKDPAGIDPGNVSTAKDLLRLLDAAASREPVRRATLLHEIRLVDQKNRTLMLNNPDRLARSDQWQLVVGKTGYTVEAGRNLVLRAVIENRPVDMVFLGAREMASVFGDAGRVRRWLVELIQKSLKT